MNAARDRYNAFIARHEIAWELVMGFLALVWVATGFLMDASGPSPALASLELVLWVLFAAEVFTRLSASRDRRGYLKGHWLDAVTLLPSITSFRLLRLLRLLRLIRAFAGVYRAAMQVQRLSQHRGFAALLSVWLGVVVISSILVFMAEHGGPQALIDSPFDALWWGVTTITTVGYGDTYPQTPEGRLGAMALMVLGVGLFSAITATVTGWVVYEQAEEQGSDRGLVGQLRELADLHENGALTEAEFAAAKRIILLDQSP